jgi:hypothetical protein
MSHVLLSLAAAPPPRLAPAADVTQSCPAGGAFALWAEDAAAGDEAFGGLRRLRPDVTVTLPRTA